jgi:hypothetical protein
MGYCQGNAYEHYCRNISNYRCNCRYHKQANIVVRKDILLADSRINLSFRLIHTHVPVIVILHIHGKRLAKMIMCQRQLPEIGGVVPGSCAHHGGTVMITNLIETPS